METRPKRDGWPWEIVRTGWSETPYRSLTLEKDAFRLTEKAIQTVFPKLETCISGGRRLHEKKLRRNVASQP
jgi:hypothetical protein